MGRTRLAIVFCALALACSSERRLDSGSNNGGRDAGPARDGGGVVATPCENAADCAVGVCDRIVGRCAECRVTSDCAADSICAEGKCEATTTCGGDLECTGAGLVCDIGEGRCRACNSAADCDELPCLGGSCVDTRACESSLDCTDLKMVCGEALPPLWPESFAGGGCVECVRNEDCTPGHGCRDGLCYDFCSGTGRVCGEVQGVSCGTCPTGAFCSEQGIACVEGPIGQYAGAGLAVSLDGMVYVARGGRSSANGGPQIWAVDLATGTTRTAFEDDTLGFINGVAVAQRQVYAALSGGALLRGPLNGSLTEWRDVPRQAQGGGPSSTSISCQALVGHADSVICNLVDYDNILTTGLYRIPLDGSPAALFEDGLFQTSGLVIVGDEAVWSFYNGDIIAKTNVRTGARQDLVSTNSELIGVADGHVYYRNFEDRDFRAPLASGTPEQPLDVLVLAASDDGVFAIAGQNPPRFVELGADGTVAKVLLDLPDIGGIDPTDILAVHRFGGDVYLVGRDTILRILQ